MALLIMIVLVLLYIGFPKIGEALFFVLFAAISLYVELFWALLRLPLLFFRLFGFSQGHPQQP